MARNCSDRTSGVWWERKPLPMGMTVSQKRNGAPEKLRSARQKQLGTCPSTGPLAHVRAPAVACSRGKLQLCLSRVRQQKYGSEKIDERDVNASRRAVAIGRCTVRRIGCTGIAGNQRKSFTPNAQMAPRAALVVCRGSETVQFRPLSKGRLRHRHTERTAMRAGRSEK